MQSASSGRIPAKEIIEQKFEHVSTVPVLFDTRRSKGLMYFTAPEYFLSLTLGRPLDSTDIWLAKHLGSTIYWPLRDENSTEEQGFRGLRNCDIHSLFARRRMTPYITTDHGKCCIIVANNKLIVVHSEDKEQLKVSVEKSIFNTDETKAYLNSLVSSVAIKLASSSTSPFTSATVSPGQIKVFPNQRHVALQYEKDYLFIVDIASDRVIFFGLPDKQLIEAFAINQDNSITAFPSLVDGQAPPDYYFHVTFDFEKARAQVVKRPSNLAYQPITDAYCIGANALLLITKNDEYKQEKESKEPDEKDIASRHFKLKRVIIDTQNKSVIKLDKVIGEALALQQVIVSDSGDFIVYQTLDRQINVFDCINKQVYSCPFDRKVKSMSLGTARIVYISAVTPDTSTMLFCSVPKFLSNRDLRERLAESLPRFSHDILGVILGFTPTGLDDGSRDIAIPQFPDIELTGASLMGMGLQSFQREDYWKKRLDAIHSIDDLNKVIEDALLQLDIILKRTRAKAFAPDTDFANLFHLLTWFKAYLMDPNIELSEEPSTSWSPERASLYEDRSYDLSPAASLWKNFRNSVILIPEIAAREHEREVLTQLQRLQELERKQPEQGKFLSIDKCENPRLLLAKTILWLKANELLLKPGLLSSLFNRPQPELAALVKIRCQIQTIDCNKDSNGKMIRDQVSAILLAFADSNACSAILEAKIRSFAHHLIPVEISEHKASSTEESTASMDFKKALDVITSLDAKTISILKALSTWLETAITQISPIKPSAGALFEEKAELTRLREFKAKLENAHQFITEKAGKEHGPDEIDRKLITEINGRLSNLVTHPGCTQNIKTQIQDVIRNLDKFILRVGQMRHHSD